MSEVKRFKIGISKIEAVHASDYDALSQQLTEVKAERDALRKLNEVNEEAIANLAQALSEAVAYAKKAHKP